MAEHPVIMAGRLFEAGFILGVVRALGRLHTEPPMLGFYRAQRQNYVIETVVDRFAEHIPSTANRDAARTLARYHLFIGHVTGMTFLDEYFDALVATAVPGGGSLQRQRAREAITVRYLQATLLGANRLEPPNATDQAGQHEHWLRQLHLTPDVLLSSDIQTGGFLNADLLLWCEIPVGRTGARTLLSDILAVDISHHAGATLGALGMLSSPGSAATVAAMAKAHGDQNSATTEIDLMAHGGLLRLLERDVVYQQQRGMLTRLAIETGAHTGVLLSERLQHYFAAFAGSDKETAKLIQAASYAASFDALLRRTGLLTETDALQYHVVGYSARGTSNMTLRADQRGLLDACAAIYRRGKGTERSARSADTPDALSTAREELLRTIARNAARLFEHGGQFTRTLTRQLRASAQGGRVEHRETLRGTFQNTAGAVPTEVLNRYHLSNDDLARFTRGGPVTTRAAHAALVERALKSECRYVFLTGSPGIGKTTTMADYLRRECNKDGYLFFYASPRKTVNADIFEKFRLRATDTQTGGPSDGTAAVSDSGASENADGATDEHTDATAPDTSSLAASLQQGPAFYAPHVLGLTSNRTIIRDAGGHAAVQYEGDEAHLPVDTRGVRFLRPEEVEAARAQAGGGRGMRGPRVVAEDTLREQSSASPGALYSICRAIGAVFDDAIQQDESTSVQHGQPRDHGPIALVTAVAIQAFKRTGERDTLEHLRQVFGSAYRAKDGDFLPVPMKAIARRARHLIIMIDEITGDDAGYAFFQRVASFFNTARLEQFGFRVTIVVSDASITGLEVVRAHFNLRQTEPDTRKIYLTLASPPEATEVTAIANLTMTAAPDPPEPQRHNDAAIAPSTAASAGPPADAATVSDTGDQPLADPSPDATDPVSFVAFDFAGPGDACLVNSNAFPADTLHLRYVVRLDVQELPVQATREEQRAAASLYSLDRRVDNELVIEVLQALAADPLGSEQLIVFVQNKLRLERIIATIRDQLEEAGISFKERQEYLRLHAENSDDDLACAVTPARRDRIRVIFMTSSASRGLSFPKARRIFLDVPRFQLETNLMELVQALYRGRGDEVIDRGDKFITFFVADRVVTLAEQRETAVRERLIDIVTLLCLVKLCVMTRIAGAVPLVGNRAVSVIPIGGKSVSGAGQAFHHDLAAVAVALRAAKRGAHSNDPALAHLLRVVSAMLASAQFAVPATPHSYLQLYEDATDERLDAWMTSDERIERAYVHGGLLIVPLDGHVIETQHQLDLTRAIQPALAETTTRALRSLYARRREFAPSLIDHLRDLRALLGVLGAIQARRDGDHLGVDTPTAASTAALGAHARGVATPLRSQRLEHTGTASAGYYVVSLANFVAPRSIERYCRALSTAADAEWVREEAGRDPTRYGVPPRSPAPALSEYNGASEELASLRQVLLTYVRDAYPLDTVLPTGNAYQRFPFLVVQSEDLRALRARRFRLDNILMSPELNLLSLLLAEA